MSQLGEMVNAVAALDDYKCPFPHKPLKHDKTNVLPPPKTENDASILSSNLDTESKHVENIDIAFTCRKKDYDLQAQFTAHHVIPGNESWPASKTQLRKWVDKKEGWIKGDIGYDVNSADNGVDLPGHTAAPAWTDQQFQRAYAFECMTADTKDRQFHDRHPAYSDFVCNVLNKIATKLEKSRKDDGCGKEDCGGAGKKKYDPPYGLLDRLNGVVVRLEKRLTGTCKKWQKPVMTSRFALMYKNKWMTQADARKELQKGRFKY